MMAVCRTCLCFAVFLIAKLVSSFEHLSTNEILTRKEVTTILGEAVNLVCYVTKSNSSQVPSIPAPTSLTYVWSKGNFSVTQSSISEIHGNVLVVRPRSDSDFGTYVCNASNRVSSTQCSISLKQGWRADSNGHKGRLATGCVNVAVLMPVLAVAVLSCLLFVHLLIRRKEPKILLPSQRRQKSTIGLTHPHAEQRKRSRDLLYNRFDNETLNNNEKKQDMVSIEMHVGKDHKSTPNPLFSPEDDTIDESRKVRRSGFSNISFRQRSFDMDDAEDESQASEESKNSTFKNESFDVGDGEDAPQALVNSSSNENKVDEGNGFYNKTYKNDSIDESDGEVFTQPLEETVGVDQSKRGTAKGFINKTYHSESMDLDDGEESAQAADAEESNVVEIEIGKGFFIKTLRAESVDVPDEEEAQAAKKSATEEPTDETRYGYATMDTYF